MAQFEDTTMTDETMPDAPSEVQIDDTIDADLLEGVALVGEIFPAGTFLFQLESFKLGYGTFEGTKTPNPEEPYASLVWKCKDEKHLGRTYRTMCPLVAKETASKARAGDPKAQADVKSRLETQKSIMEAVGFKPKGPYSFVGDVLPLSPELKILINHWTNKAGRTMALPNKYLPANRPSFE